MNVVFRHDVVLDRERNYRDPLECSTCEAVIASCMVTIPAQGRVLFVELYSEHSTEHLRVCTRCLKALAAYVGG